MHVVGQGLVCSLGYDVVSACAAARAGLARPTELPFPSVDADGFPTQAIGHPVPLLGASFEGDARLTRLLEGALLDLQRDLPAETLRHARVGFALGFPSSSRTRSGLQRIADPDERSVYDEDLTLETPAPDAGRATRIVEKALRLAELELTPSRLATSTAGHAATLMLLETAQTWLQNGEVDVVLLASVDSLITAPTLRWLQLTGRLKTDDNPVGLSPGEAANVVALTLPATVRTMAMRPQAKIVATAVSRSGATLLGDSQPDGRGLAEAITRVLEGQAPPDAPWLLSDHNGEEYAARDWGHALLRLPEPQRVYGSADAWLPAAWLGDVGCALGGVSLCAATRACQRGYAPGPTALLLGSADDAERAACVVTGVGA